MHLHQHLHLRSRSLRITAAQSTLTTEDTSPAKKIIRTKPRYIESEVINNNRSKLTKSFTFVGVENIKRIEIRKVTNPDESILFNEETASFHELPESQDAYDIEMANQEEIRELMRAMNNNAQAMTEMMAQNHETQNVMQQTIAALTQLAINIPPVQQIQQAQPF